MKIEIKQEVEYNFERRERQQQARKKNPKKIMKTNIPKERKINIFFFPDI